MKDVVEKLWSQKDSINLNSDAEIKAQIESCIDVLDRGELCVVTQQADGNWLVNEWVKKIILLYFKISGMAIIGVHNADRMCGNSWYDKIPLKFDGWREKDMEPTKVRLVPGSIVRRGSFLSKNVVVMPSFVNIGAYVGEGTMIDTWASVGSCVYVGKHCHISGGSGLGGVLEPLQASPVIIEDNVFIGARSEVVEGVIVKKGAVLSMGVYIGATTPIVDRNTGEVTYGVVPEGAVVIPGSRRTGKTMANGLEAPAQYCVIIVKYRDDITDSKIKLNELLRDL